MAIETASSGIDFDGKEVADQPFAMSSLAKKDSCVTQEPFRFYGESSVNNLDDHGWKVKLHFYRWGKPVTPITEIIIEGETRNRHFAAKASTRVDPEFLLTFQGNQLVAIDEESLSDLFDAKPTISVSLRTSY